MTREMNEVFKVIVSTTSASLSIVVPRSTAPEAHRHFEVVAERLETKIVPLSDWTNKRIYRLDAKSEYLATDLTTGTEEVDVIAKIRGRGVQ